MKLSGHARQAVVVAAMLGVALLAGCSNVIEAHKPSPPQVPYPNETPRELKKVSLPTYTIEPPDILLVDVVNAVPKAPYRVRELDVLHVEATGVLPQRPVASNYMVESGGAVNLGEPYGMIQVGRMTLPEATQAITEHLKSVGLRNPEVSVTLVQFAARQQIAGEHLVGPDGYVTLGIYGDVYVTGLTREEARRAIEAQLGKFLETPEVSVDVFSYNSKFYYLVVQGAGNGDGVTRIPITGNETVMDAVSMIQGLQPFSSKRIWIARPAPPEHGCAQILPVDWDAITQRADVKTNFQLMPGDRLFVEEDKWVAANSWLSKVIAPAERVMGFILLTTSTVQRLVFFDDPNSGGFF